MNPRELLRRFPNASKSILQANCGDVDRDSVTPTPAPQVVSDRMCIVVHGQIRGGKNNMIVTKTGKHVPKKEWARWRDEVVQSIKAQLPRNWIPIAVPTNVRIEYVAGDLRRRDFPAICDSIWHCMEKAGVVEDDTLLWPTESTRSYDKANPRTIITFLPQ